MATQADPSRYDETLEWLKTQPPEVLSRLTEDLSKAWVARQSAYSINLVSLGPNFIGAIKDLRTLAGMELREAKALIDAFRNEGKPVVLDLDGTQEELLVRIKGLDSWSTTHWAVKPRSNTK